MQHLLVVPFAAFVAIFFLATDSSATKSVAKELFPNATSSTHNFLLHTKLMKNKSGLEVPIIEKLIIQQGQHHVRQRELITTDKQAKYIIEVH
ncbi:MAG: hypothetical protein MUO63_02640, partial [Desulfobulbaceae bacterium]|nr:hypothetical protein [Desulfobulbaceae bacterium]